MSAPTAEQCVRGSILAEVYAQLEELSDDTCGIIAAHSDSDAAALTAFADDLRETLYAAVSTRWSDWWAEHATMGEGGGECPACGSEFDSPDP